MKCKYCGKEFERHVNQKYCCVKCRNAYNYSKIVKNSENRDGYVEVVCKTCNMVSFVPMHRAKRYTCCSVECLAKYNSIRYSQKKECLCPICGKIFYLKPYLYNRAKVHCCSNKCLYEYKKITFCGNNNHQYGLKGRLNASFIDKPLQYKNNKLKEILIYVGDWYNNHNYHGRVTEHRYLVEKNHHLFDDCYFDNIDGWFYLKSEYVVHHIDLNHSNNELSNLCVLSKGEHRSLHNKLRKQKRNELGRFIKNN